MNHSQTTDPFAGLATPFGVDQLCRRTASASPGALRLLSGFCSFPSAGRLDDSAAAVVARREAGFTAENLREMAGTGIADGHTDFDNAGVGFL